MLSLTGLVAMPGQVAGAKLKKHNFDFWREKKLNFVDFVFWVHETSLLWLFLGKPGGIIIEEITLYWKQKQLTDWA